jgi:hypothetical protein
MPTDHCRVPSDARLESAWRREQLRHLRARQAAWRAVHLLARRPSAWFVQGVEVLLFGVKLACMYWGLSSGVLILWCWATGMSSSGLQDEVQVLRSVAELAVVCSALWWIWRGRLPVGSPFIDAWRKAYALHRGARSPRN